MNYEQKLKLPVTRKELLVDTFEKKQLVYAEGLGIIGFERVKGKVHPPPPGSISPVVDEDYSSAMFIYVPTEEFFLKKIVIEAPLKIVRFDFHKVMEGYKPNTGLTVAKDKKGLVTLLLNYRKVANGTETISLLGLNEQFVKKEIDPLSPYCRVVKDRTTGIITVSPL